VHEPFGAGGQVDAESHAAPRAVATARAVSSGV
jgi:hypothetical protein